MLEQKVLPVISKHKELEYYLKSKYQYCIILNVHINNLDSMVKKLHNHNKLVIVHIDLINGLCNDKYGAEFLCQKIKVNGIISTKAAPLLIAKDHGCLTIQRIFLIDSNSIHRSLELISKVNPDIVEVLPAVTINYIQKELNDLNIPIIGGGLVNSINEVNFCLKQGILAVTSSNKDLWL